MFDRQVDGLIHAAMSTRMADPSSRRADHPTVLLNCLDESGYFTCVVPDEQAAGRQAVQLLLEAGSSGRHPRRRRTPLHAAAHRKASTPGLERMRGIEAAVAAAGLRLAGVAECDWSTPEGGYRATRSLLEAGARPTALICCNDRLAFGAYQAVRDSRVEHPVRDVGDLLRRLGTGLLAAARPDLHRPAPPRTRQDERSRYCCQASRDRLSTGSRCPYAAGNRSPLRRADLSGRDGPRLARGRRRPLESAPRTQLPQPATSIRSSDRTGISTPRTPTHPPARAARTRTPVRARRDGLLVPSAPGSVRRRPPAARTQPNTELDDELTATPTESHPHRTARIHRDRQHRTAPPGRPRLVAPGRRLPDLPAQLRRRRRRRPRRPRRHHLTDALPVRARRRRRLAEPLLPLGAGRRRLRRRRLPQRRPAAGHARRLRRDGRRGPPASASR